MKTTWLINMVNASIVLGLDPTDEDSWCRRNEIYMILESVMPLDYALTPHITMAYFRPGTYSQEQVQQFSAAECGSEHHTLDEVAGTPEFFDMNPNQKRRKAALNKELVAVERQEIRRQQAALKAKPTSRKTGVERRIPEKVYAGLDSAFYKGVWSGIQPRAHHH